MVQPRPGAPIAETALEFILSEEFRDAVLLAALDDRLAPAPKLEPTLRSWAEEAFGIGGPMAETAPGLVARILRQPWIVRRIQERQPFWPRGPLAAALTRIEAGSTEHLLSRIASGVEVLAAAGLRPVGSGGRVVFTSSDPWIEFKLAGPCAKAELVLLRLGAALDDSGPARLYLDCGSGFLEGHSLPLHAGEGGVAEVVVAAVQGLRSLRWDPVDRPSSGTLSLLAARPLSRDEAARRLQNAAASPLDLFTAVLAEVAEDPAAAIAVALSRALSPCPPEGYGAWLAANEPSGPSAERLWRGQLAALKVRPLISVLTPTYNTPLHLLHEAVESVRAQVYPDWQLCIADDASSDLEVKRALQAYAEADSRIRVVLRGENGHISAASNSALELVTGEWTVLLDHDDLLRPNALLAVAREIEAHPDAQLIYSDEDKIEGRVRSNPYFKPDYSPELLLAQNYFNHLTAHRTANIRAVGGWRLGLEGSQDYDLTLRVLERVPSETVRHIPEVLYHWRIVEGSTARGVEEKGYAVDAGLRALGEHLDRTRPGARAEALPDVPYYRVRPCLPDPPPRVSLIIPTRDKADILEVAVRSILQRSTYPDYEILVVDNGSREAATFELFEALSADDRVRVIPYAGRFNYPALNNYAARLASGSVFGLINNDIEVISPDWMEEMVSWAVQDGIGCVGARLLYPDMTVQHAGVVVGVGGVAGHGHKNARRSDPGYFGRLQVHANVSAVTAACLLVRREVFEEASGLDEDLAVAFNDVDFCLRVRNAGRRNLFTPFAELIHHESKSRGLEDTPEKVARFNAEAGFMMQRWGLALTNDPFYSPHLTYEREDFSLGEHGWAGAA